MASSIGPSIAPLGDDDPLRIGPFTIVGVLGGGGMGRVYLAQSLGGRRVAVKVVHPQLARHQEFRDRFRREIDAARRVNSVYTAGLVDADPAANPPWMATRYIDGRSLQQQIRAVGPLGTDQVLRLGLGVAEALSAIHAAGYVHRDLKPANVVVDTDGPHVIDFGIIRQAAAESGLTSVGQVIGTPRYMSPEQMRGWRTDSATDIYAFGALLHFVATGHPPPRDGDRIDVSAITDPLVADVVRACLAHDPQDRPSATALVRMLAATLAGLPDRAADRRPPAPVVPRDPALTDISATPSSEASPPDVSGLLDPPTVASPPPVAPTSPVPADPPDRRRRLILAAAGLAVVVGVGAVALPRLMPDDDRGGAAACPGLPADSGRTLIRRAGTGECYGLVDTALASDGPESGFGRDVAARRLQAKLFSTNRLDLPLTADDLTVVWLGALTCPRYRADGVTCEDGRVYDAERQELQALQLAQSRSDLRGRVHVVVANAGADMRFAPEVADLLVAHRSAFGRLVVIGGGDSRASTKAAITTLVRAGIPFVAPELSSDDEGPGLPFVDAPGYLQLTGPNQAWARSTVAFVARYSPVDGRRLLVYHVGDPGDLYAESLARDLQFAALAEPATAGRPVRIIASPADVPESVCLGHRSTGETPTALFFADRWSTFGALADRLTTLCGPTGPALVMGNDSVNRFMTNDAARGQVKAGWPLAYFTNGAQCSEIETSARREPGGEADKLLTTARTVLHQCDPASGSQQMGDGVSLFWDAVALADKVVPVGGTGALADVTLAGASRRITVAGGRVIWSGVQLAPQPLCVLTVDRSGPGDRSVANCDRAFTGR